MAYAYTPAYYSSFQDTIASFCKSFLPFASSGRARRGLPAAEMKLAQRHSETLKWQQESFHRILQLIGLNKEGIVTESEVSAFRSHLLDTLVASPAEPEPPNVVRDKLLFLQELLHAKCISADDYHYSKRPLLQRLAVQGEEIDSRDVIICGPTNTSPEKWSVIDLKDCKKIPSPTTNDNKKAKIRTPFKNLFNSSTAVNSTNSRGILMHESSPSAPNKMKKRSFRRGFFQPKEHHQELDNGGERKNNWGFDAMKRWKRGGGGDESETPYLLPGERSDNFKPGKEEISIHLPVERSDSNRILPKFVRETEKSSPKNEKVEKKIESGDKWVTFNDFEEDEENLHPNIFAKDRNYQSALLF